MIKKKRTPFPPDDSVFHSREREAQFWEEHFDEAWKVGKPIKVKFAPVLSETINIRFDSNTLGKLRTTAQKKGLGPTQLIRMWVMEKLSGGKNFQPAV